MWLLFIVCGYYCSDFFYCDSTVCRFNYKITSKDLMVKRYDSWYSYYYYCRNYEEASQLTKPGYLCQDFCNISECNTSGKRMCRYLGDYAHCCNNYEYMAPPKRTFQPTQTLKPTPLFTVKPSPLSTPQHTPARTYVRLSVKCRNEAKINNLAFLTTLLQ